ncbi:MAG: hypothetical protein WDW19_01050 [Neisseriaceae bacterium]
MNFISEDKLDKAGERVKKAQEEYRKLRTQFKEQRKEQMTKELDSLKLQLIQLQKNFKKFNHRGELLNFLKENNLRKIAKFLERP